MHTDAALGQSGKAFWQHIKEKDACWQNIRKNDAFGKSSQKEMRSDHPSVKTKMHSKAQTKQQCCFRTKDHCPDEAVWIFDTIKMANSAPKGK